MNTNEKLAYNEQEFAKENLKLVYKYLSLKKLKEEDFFDIVILGYLFAVKQYLTKEHLKKYSFSTICFKCMDRSMSLYYKRQNTANKYICNIPLHLDYEIDEKAELYDFIPTIGNFEDDVVFNLAFSQAIENLKPAEKEIVHLLKENYSFVEIARIRNVSHQAVS